MTSCRYPAPALFSTLLEINVDAALATAAIAKIIFKDDAVDVAATRILCVKPAVECIG
jgi:hypothetical protein